MQRFELAIARGRVNGNERAALLLALGRAHLAAGEPGLAASPLAQAAATDAPVAPWASWFASEAELARGNPSAAASACARARERWPEGPYAEDCLVRLGDAQAAAGSLGAARAAWQQWLEAHPDSPREEPIRLSMALAAARVDPRAAIPRLQELVLDHGYHSTGLAAEAALRDLAARGFATELPDTVDVAQRRAQERRRCGATREALEAFEALARRSREDATLRAWVEAQEQRFRLDARQNARVAESLARRLQARPDAEVAWQRWLALSRGGMWSQAADQYAEGMARWPRRFSDKLLLPRALTVAGRWKEATEAWDALAEGKGKEAKEARWMAAFAAYRGKLPDARTRLEAVLASDDAERSDAARWYRSRLLEDLGLRGEARAAREELLRRSPQGWYGLLAAQALAPKARGSVRDGSWPHPDLPRAALPSPAPLTEPPAAALGWAQHGAKTLLWDSWTTQDTPLSQSEGASAQVPASAPSSLMPLPVRDLPPELVPPAPVRPSHLYDPQAADRRLQALAREREAELPDLKAVRDLAWAGQHDLSGAHLGKLLEALEAEKKDLELPAAEARQVYLWTRDLHHAVKTCWNAPRQARDAEQRLEALRCAFPAAESAALWKHGERWDLDPFFMMGIMRQESVFKPWVVSSAGAIGLVQVMPKTGGRVAALLGETSYSPADLTDPSTNLRYGSWYMGQLMRRFGGAFPLAAASYNGGPHNVSSWLRPWRRPGGTFDVRVDDLVEAMPYPETRDYVKKVSAWYANFLLAHGPADARLRIPLTVPLDDAEVIDF